MTKLEQQIAAIAEATGKTTVVGRQGHKDEWFAHCDGVEVAGSTASGALRDLAASLEQRADDAAFAARTAVTTNEGIRNALRGPS